MTANLDLKSLSILEGSLPFSLTPICVAKKKKKNTLEKNTNNQILKCLKLVYTLFQRRYMNGQQVQEKVFNSTDHQGNANQNHKYLTPIRIASTRQEHWQGCGEKGTLMHCWWERKLAKPL